MEIPVLVGFGITGDRRPPQEQSEACDLMAQALQKSAEEAGATQLLAMAEMIYCPQGSWGYRDVGKLVATRIGAKRARTVLTGIGILQQSMFNKACTAIASGKQEVILIVGGEARMRALAGGDQVTETQQSPYTSPDVHLKPRAELWEMIEMLRGIELPAEYYSVMETAFRHHLGISPDAYAESLAKFWCEFSEIAAQNKYSWYPDPIKAESLTTLDAKNSMVAFPYTKKHCSQWNVDQAAGFILCSEQRAKTLGLEPSAWVYPWAGTESNYAPALSRRRYLFRNPAVAIAGKKTLSFSNTTFDELDFIDLYSCFPSAVRIQAAELGLDINKPWTITGGMRFAGGPLNNYSLQALATLGEKLREKPTSKGLVSNVSGILTKIGFGLWSGKPPPQGFSYADVTQQAARTTELCSLNINATGIGQVSGYTVKFKDNHPKQGIAFCDMPDGCRTIVNTSDPKVIDVMLQKEFCGTKLNIKSDGLFTL